MVRLVRPPVLLAEVAASTATLDLRAFACEDVWERVESALGAALNRDSCVRKRRSLGARSDRSTWVRIEVRRWDKLAEQGFNGVEAAGVLRGIAKPAWHRSVAWNDAEHEVMWRADETDLVTAPPIKPGGILTTDPGLSAAWWARLNASLGALAAVRTSRVATPHTVAMTQTRLTTAITHAFPDLIDTTVDEWTAAHADLNWANLTAPECWLLDWEDWGMAPRGLDAAYLWVNSLAVPELAERVYRERHTDLDTRSGMLSQLFFCAEVLTAPADYAGPLAEPARHVAQRLLSALRP